MKTNITIAIDAQEITDLIKAHLEAKGMTVKNVNFRFKTEYANMHDRGTTALDFAHVNVDTQK